MCASAAQRSNAHGVVEGFLEGNGAVARCAAIAAAAGGRLCDALSAATAFAGACCSVPLLALANSALFLITAVASSASLPVRGNLGGVVATPMITALSEAHRWSSIFALGAILGRIPEAGIGRRPRGPGWIPLSS